MWIWYIRASQIIFWSSKVRSFGVIRRDIDIYCLVYCWWTTNFEHTNITIIIFVTWKRLMLIFYKCNVHILSLYVMLVSGMPVHCFVVIILTDLSCINNKPEKKNKRRRAYVAKVSIFTRQNNGFAHTLIKYNIIHAFDMNSITKTLKSDNQIIKFWVR